MPVAHSSLSVAIAGFADYLDDQFSEDVTVTVDTPQKAQEQAKGASTDILNIFIYRLAPSGFHADASQNEATFVRAHILITPFPRSQDEEGATDLDLRVLGQALAVLQSNPVIPVTLPAAPGSPEAAGLAPETTYYQMQAVLQAPPMEELNHIWTTQGGELAYRLSAAYELALIPIEPLDYVAPPEQVSAAVLDVSAGPPITDGGISASPIGILPADDTKADWLPHLMYQTSDGLANTHNVAASTANVGLRLSGRVGETAEIFVDWVRADESEDSQAPVDRVVASVNLDDTASAINVTLTNAADGDSARIFARPKTPADSVAGNVLVLTVGGA